MNLKIWILLMVLPILLFADTNDIENAISKDILEYKYVPSKFNNLIIYQVMVESFQDGDTTRNYEVGYGPSHHNGDLRGIINALPYIKSLNVNAIWLTPIFDSEKSTARFNPDYKPDPKLDATGYFTRNYFKIDPNFGTIDDARELVKKAHDLGMYLFLDGAFGHHKGNIPISPKGNKPKGKNTKVSYPGSLEFYKEVALFWIDELEIDGWRLDQAYQIPLEYLHEIRLAVEEKCAERKAEGKTWGTLGYMVGEIWRTSDIISKKGYGTEETPGLLSNFNFPLRYKIVQVLAGEEKGLRIPDCSVLAEGMESHRKYPKFAIPNLMLTNHDLVRFGDLIQRVGLSGPESHNYWKRHKCAFAFMTAYTGPITIYYGDEIGEELKNFAQKIDDPKMKCWLRGLCDDHVSRTSGRIDDQNKMETDLKNYVSDLMKFRSKYEALYNGRTINLVAKNNLYADLKISDDEKILFIMNIAIKKDMIRIAKKNLDCNQIQNYFTGEKIKSKHEIFEISIDALSSGFFICK